LTPEQKVELVEEESETEEFQNVEGESFLGIEDAKMSGVFSSTKPFDVRFLILLRDNVRSTMFSIKNERVTALHCNNFVSLGNNTHGHI
jgi:hypothetical protein